MSRLEEWLTALQDRDPETRLMVVRQLDELPVHQRLPLLVSLLGDTEWRVRKAATTRLKAITPTPEFLDALLAEIVQQVDPWRRTAAMEVLIEQGSRENENGRVVPFLVNALRAVDLDSRKFVVEVLGYLGSLLSLVPLIAELREEDENHQLSVIDALAKIGDQVALPAVIERLTNGTLHVKFAALSALQRLGNTAAIPSVVDALENKSLRMLAIETLGHLGDVAAIGPLWSWWAGSAVPEQQAALVALAQIAERVGEADRTALELEFRNRHDAGLAERLVELLTSDDRRVQRAAIIMAGYACEPAAVDHLVDQLAGDQAEPASHALSMMAGELLDTLLQVLPAATPTIHRALIHILSHVPDQRLVPVMREAIRSADGHTRRSGALGLALLQDEAAAPALVELLRDPFPDVQESAIQSLRHCRSGGVLSSVLSMLSDASPTIRRNAALALGALQDAHAGPHLTLAVNDPDDSVRAAALTALDAIDDAATVDHLLLALGDESPRVRLTAVKALPRYIRGVAANRWTCVIRDPDMWVRTAATQLTRHCPDELAAPMLRQYMQDASGAVRIAALEIIAEQPHRGCLLTVMDCLEGQDGDVTQSAIRTLAAMVRPARPRGRPMRQRHRGELMAVLVQRLSNCVLHESWVVRGEALAALSRMAPDEARKHILRQSLRDPHPKIRQASSRLLAQLGDEFSPERKARRAAVE